MSILTGNNPFGEYKKSIEEKITKDTPMGDVIKDFQQSDAPQFKGKSDEKKREMAIAAKLNAEDASGEDEEKFHKKLDKLVHKTFGKSEDEKKED